MVYRADSGEHLVDNTRARTDNTKLAVRFFVVHPALSFWLTIEEIYALYTGYMYANYPTICAIMNKHEIEQIAKLICERRADLYKA